MASKLKVDQIAESTVSAGIELQHNVTIPTGKTLTVADGVGASIITSQELPIARGGTNIASYTAGDFLYATGATTLTKLAKGTSLQQMRMNVGATAPEWTPAPSASGGLTLTNEQVTSGGNNKNFASLPSGVKFIMIMHEYTSTNGVGFIGIQIGDAGGIETSGYLSTSTETIGATQSAVERTDMFIVMSVGVQLNHYQGTTFLSLQDASTNTWTQWGGCGSDTNSRCLNANGGRKALSAELTQLNFYTTDSAFDQAGAVSISYF